MSKTHPTYDEYAEALLHLVEHGITLEPESEKALAVVRTTKPIFVWESAMAASRAIRPDLGELLAFHTGEVVVHIGNALDTSDRAVPGPVGWFTLGWLMALRAPFVVGDDKWRAPPEVMERVRTEFREQDELLRSVHEDEQAKLLAAEDVLA